MPKVVVFLSGGVIQSAIADVSGLEVIVLDAEDGNDPADISGFNAPDGERHEGWIYIVPAENDPAFVEAAKLAEPVTDDE